jgi:CheY-like chemotaxis protein
LSGGEDGKTWGVGQDQYPTEDEVDRTLLQSAAAVRRSREAIQQLDSIIDRQRTVIGAAEDVLDVSDRVLAQVDVDLTVLDRRSPDGRPPRARVLVVDDNPTIREVLQLLFELEFEEDAEFRVVASGREAIDAASWVPHVVILDWQMPEMDGLETARRLRAQLGLGPTIVMYSSMLAADAEGDAIAAGADRYVEKGADVDSLVAEVERAITALDRRRQASS